MLYGVVDTVLTGHASAVDLAAMGLGAGIYSTVFVSLLGALNALNPVIAQHHGARRDVAIGASYVQGLWLAGLLSAGGGLLLAFPERWLAWLHAPSEVDAVVTRYLRVLALGLRASLMFRVISALNVAVARPQVVMRMQVADLVLKVLLSYLDLRRARAAPVLRARGDVVHLHHAARGAARPRLGAVGGALASVAVFWGLLAAGWAHTRIDPFYRRFAIERAGPRWAGLRELIQLDVPIPGGWGSWAATTSRFADSGARRGVSQACG
jgi:MATE family multidrug resistance protein